MSEKISRKEMIPAGILLALPTLFLLWAVAFLGIEAVEKRLDTYPIISERTIVVRSLKSNFNGLCQQRRNLERNLWYRRDALPEESAKNIRSEIVSLDEQLELIRLRCEALTSKPCTITCQDFDEVHDQLLYDISPW